MVVISCPSIWIAQVRQARAGRSSIRTVQAPQTPCSQPTWVPVRPRSSRSTSDSRRRGCTETSWSTPFTERVIEVRLVIAQVPSGALGRRGQRPNGQRLRQVLAILGRQPPIVFRGNRASDRGTYFSAPVDVRQPADKSRRELIETDGSDGDAAERQGKALDLAVIRQEQGRRYRDNGEISVALGEYLEPPAAGGRKGWKAHRRDHLVGAKPRDQAGDEEVPRLDHALAGTTFDPDLRVEERGDQRQLRGGVGVGKAAPDRAALADGIVTDGRGCGRQGWTCARHLRIDRQPMMACQAADFDRAGSTPDKIEFEKIVDVDQMTGAGEPQIQHRSETLAAGEQFRVAPQAAQGRERIGNRLRPMIVEWRWLHRVTRPSWRRFRRRTHAGD